jgi:hypothetical protein
MACGSFSTIAQIFLGGGIAAAPQPSQALLVDALLQLAMAGLVCIVVFMLYSIIRAVIMIVQNLTERHYARQAGHAHGRNANKSTHQPVRSLDLVSSRGRFRGGG